MILTGKNILKKMQEGEITISPFVESNLNPNSYNYRLGNEIIKLTSSVIDLEGNKNEKNNKLLAKKEKILIPEEGYVLEPGNLYLANTMEKMGSSHHITSLIGKSSMGRLGLFLQISANLGNQGSMHQWTLELCCRIPIRIYPGQIIGQVSFWTVYGDALPYDGYYGKLDNPTLNKNFEHHQS